jgi:hypothetical protein
VNLIFLVLALAQPQLQPTEEPSSLAAREVIAAERAFAARAQSEGQWTAFRATAAPDSIMLAPDPINTHTFLRRFTSDPAVAVMWWPGRVWISCDGSLAVTAGPWVRNGGTQVGSFTTVWQRGDDGGWKWTFDGGRELPRAIGAPDAPIVETPYCATQPRALNLSVVYPPPVVQFEGRAPNEGLEDLSTMRWGEEVARGESRDGSLRWEIVRVTGRGAHAYVFRLHERTRNHERTALTEFHGLEPAPAQ